MTHNYGERAQEARRIALNNPTMTKADIARAVGMTRQGVSLALANLDVSLPDGRYLARGGSRRGLGRTNALEAARRKMKAGQPITREERHLLQEDYRRREREVTS